MSDIEDRTDTSEAAIVPAPKEHADGIYFGLDKDEYHRDPALGSTDIKMLLKHPGDYWWQSWRNPSYEPKATNFLDWGNAFHSLILEGEEDFKDRYYRGPAKRDFPGLMVTMEDLRKFLRGVGKATTGTKEVLVQRVLDHEPAAPVWDKIVKDSVVLAEGRYILDHVDYDTVVLSSKMITKNPECSKAFVNGYPEVSIFWEQAGVRCKARIDYLRLKANIDLKSIRNWKSKSFRDACIDEIFASGYDIQAAHYLNARSQIPALIKAGRVFGDVSRAWLDRLADETAKASVLKHSWIFYQAEGAPIAIREDWGSHMRHFVDCQNAIVDALRIYTRHVEVFGDDIWVDVSPRQELTDGEVPAWWGLRTYRN